jgi:acetyl-CoA carboxylase biotin carboxyl carrier protein
VNKVSWTLSEDEVRQINLIIETLNRSSFDYLQIESGELKLTIAKGQAPSSEAARATAEIGVQVSALTAQSSDIRPVAAASEGAEADATKADGTVTIVAPLVGRFYSQPEPGALPFVVVGSEVSDDSTVGLIEVMKTFSAVRAGVAGIITEICAQDAVLVEYGQILYRVRPKS